MTPRAFITRQEDFSGPCLPNVPYSRAVRVRGNLSFDTPISILTIRRCKEESSAGLHQWLTGTCQTICAWNWATVMGVLIDSILRAILNFSRAVFNCSSEGFRKLPVNATDAKRMPYVQLSSELDT